MKNLIMIYNLIFNNDNNLNNDIKYTDKILLL